MKTQLFKDNVERQEADPGCGVSQREGSHMGKMCHPPTFSRSPPPSPHNAVGALQKEAEQAGDLELEIWLQSTGDELGNPEDMEAMRGSPQSCSRQPGRSLAHCWSEEGRGEVLGVRWRVSGRLAQLSGDASTTQYEGLLEFTRWIRETRQASY